MITHVHFVNVGAVTAGTLLLDGEKGASGVLLTLEIMTMKKVFKHVYNTWL